MRSIVTIALAASLLASLCWYLDLTVLLASLAKIDRLSMGFGIALSVCGLGVQWVKWRWLLCKRVPTASWNDALYSLLGGAALGLFTPGRLGEVGRGMFFAGQRKEITLLAAFDKLSSSFTTVLLGGIAAWWLWPGLRGWLAGSALVLGCALWVSWYYGRARYNFPLQIRSWGMILGLSLAFNLVFIVQFYWFCAAGGVGGIAIFVAVPVIFALKTLLPIAFLDLGVREAAAVLVFSALNVVEQPAFIASVLVFGLNVLLPALVGYIWIGTRTAMVGKRLALRREIAI